MIDHIRRYYLDEKALATPTFIAAGGLLLIGLLLYFKFDANPVAKGMGTGLLIAAGLGLATGIFSTIHNNKKLVELEARATRSEHELRTSELQRLDKMTNVTFRYAFIVFGMLMMAAMVLIILTTSDYWRGIGIALMPLVALSTVFDGFNLHRNRKCQASIQAAE